MKYAWIVLGLVAAGAGCVPAAPPAREISSFEECAAAGNPVMESYPRQCRAGGKTFVEDVAPPAPPPAGDVEIMPAVRLGEEFTLAVDEGRVFEDGLQVTLMKIDDSRCPKDVQCIWAGELSPTLKIENIDKADSAKELLLGTTTRTSVEASGYRFELKGATETTATLAVTK
jgi:hypothetical protein